ncbi:MAG: nicotinate-nicotinamide nucleotide adenylyltransferase, partial [Solirubrobacterales bacterium]
VTLEAFRDRDPEAELVFLLGADAALALGEWERPKRILELASIGVADRDTARREDAAAAVTSIAAGAGVELIEMPAVDASSTEVRRLIGASRDVRGLVPGAVAELIEEGSIYRP